MGNSITARVMTRGIAAAVFGVALACALSISFGAGQAMASPNDLASFKGKVTMSHYKGDYAVSYTARVKSGKYYVPSSKKISDATSSNKKVATVKVNKDTYVNGKKKIKYYYLTVTKKGIGKTNISYKFGGKKYKVQLNVVKYQNPVKSLKVGSQQYAELFNKTPERDYSKSIPYPKGKISITPQANWKIAGIVIFGSNNKLKNVKNGYKMKQTESFFYVMMKNKKNGVYEYLYL